MEWLHIESMAVKYCNFLIRINMSAPCQLHASVMVWSVLHLLTTNNLHKHVHRAESQCCSKADFLFQKDHARVIWCYAHKCHKGPPTKPVSAGFTLLKDESASAQTACSVPARLWTSYCLLFSHKVFPSLWGNYPLLTRNRKRITLQPVFYRCSMANSSGDSCKVSFLLRSS